MQNSRYTRLFLQGMLLLGCLNVKAQSYAPQDTARANFMKKVLEKHARTQIPSPPYQYTVEDVKFKDSVTGLQYGATLTKPIGKSSFPTVVLISGTGAQDRDYTAGGHKFFWVLADYLGNHGVGVLRMDDRNTGETNGVYALANSLDFAKDAYAGVKWLYTRRDIDTARIGLIGHSEGGILGPMVYKMNPAAVKFMVLACGPTVGLRAVNRLQTRAYFNNIYKQNDTLVNAYMRLHAAIVDHIPQEATDFEGLKILMNKAADTFYRTEDLSVSKRLRVSGGENGGEMLRSSFSAFLKPWWQFILPYDMVKDVKEIKSPVLGIYGDKDQQVLPIESMELLKTNLPKNKYSEVVMYKNMNHFMQPDTVGDPKNYDHIPITIMPEVLVKIANWINGLPKHK